MSNKRPEKISIIIFSGNFNKIHYALAMASAAASINIPVTLLFTMEATRALLASPKNAWQKMPAGGSFKIEETGEYCTNDNNEPCECGTRGWADVLFSNCRLKYPGKSLILVKEKYNVKH